MKVAVGGLRALQSPRKDAGVAAPSLHEGTQTTYHRAYSHTQTTQYFAFWRGARHVAADGP